MEKIVRAGSEDFSKNGKTTVVEIKVRYSFGVVFSDLYIGDTTLIITHHGKYTQMGLAWLFILCENKIIQEFVSKADSTKNKTLHFISCFSNIDIT